MFGFVELEAGVEDGVIGRVVAHLHAFTLYRNRDTVLLESNPRVDSSTFSPRTTVKSSYQGIAPE